MLRVVLAAFFIVAAALSFPPTRSFSRESIDRVRVVYAEQKNPLHVTLRQDLQRAKLLEKIREFLSPFRLPRTLTLKLEGCDGDLNAWYEDDNVTVCYDYLAFIIENAAKAPEALGLTYKSAVIGATLDLVLHEVGHAVFDMLKIPLLGREEDAADMFAAYIILQFDRRDARQLITATAYLSASEARNDQSASPALKEYANEHALPAQRYFNLLCLAYGSSATTFGDVLSLGRLPSARAEGCRDEYRQLEYAFKMLISPHLDSKLVNAVRRKKWFDFGDAPRPKMKVEQ